MISETAPAVEEQRPFALTLLISEVDVVEPPCRCDAGYFCVGFLLPIEPPEIDALLLERMEDEVEVICGEFLVGDVEGNVLVGRWVDAHGFGHRRVLGFPGLNA